MTLSWEDGLGMFFWLPCLNNWLPRLKLQAEETTPLTLIAVGGVLLIRRQRKRRDEAIICFQTAMV